MVIIVIIVLQIITTIITILGILIIMTSAGASLRTGGATQSDEFSEKFQTAFDPAVFF